MREPDDLTGWVDDSETVWVRVDYCPGRGGGTWWPVSASGHVGLARRWAEVEVDCGQELGVFPSQAATSVGSAGPPLNRASAALTEWAIGLVGDEYAG